MRQRFSEPRLTGKRQILTGGPGNSAVDLSTPRRAPAVLSINRCSSSRTSTRRVGAPPTFCVIREADGNLCDGRPAHGVPLTSGQEHGGSWTHPTTCASETRRVGAPPTNRQCPSCVPLAMRNRSRGGRKFPGKPRGQAHFRRPRFLARATYSGRKMSQTPSRERLRLCQCLAGFDWMNTAPSHRSSTRARP